MKRGKEREVRGKCAGEEVLFRDIKLRTILSFSRVAD